MTAQREATWGMVNEARAESRRTTEQLYEVLGLARGYRRVMQEALTKLPGDADAARQILSTALADVQ